GVQPESLDQVHDSGAGLTVADDRTLPPDVLFDRQWALTVLDRSFTSLETDLAAEGKARLLQVLKPWLIGGVNRGDQRAAAAELGLSATAIRVAVHRLRQRFRDAVRAELRQTLSAGAAVGEKGRGGVVGCVA